MKNLLFASFLFCINSYGFVQKKKFVVVMASFNNGPFIKAALDSLVKQDYDPTLIRVIYMDDCSTDDSLDYLEAYLAQKQFPFQIIILKNKYNYGGLFNTWKGVYLAEEDEIIVCLDGDDELVGTSVFSLLNEEYSSQDIWLTYGQYVRKSDNCIGHCDFYDEAIIIEQSYRMHKWKASALRTFYAGLFKQIRLENFFYNSIFMKAGWDLCFMFPMLEMAGKRFKFLNTILYEYNDLNSLNDFKKDIFGQVYLDIMMRNRKRYNHRDTYRLPKREVTEVKDVPVLYFNTSLNKEVDRYLSFAKQYGTQYMYMVLPEEVRLLSAERKLLEDTYLLCNSDSGGVDLQARRRNQTEERKYYSLDFLQGLSSEYVLCTTNGIELLSQELFQESLDHMTKLSLDVGFIVKSQQLSSQYLFPVTATSDRENIYICSKHEAGSLLVDKRTITGLIIKRSLLIDLIQSIYFTYNNFYAVLAAFEEPMLEKIKFLLFVTTE